MAYSQGGHTHVKRTSATRCGDGVLDTQMCFESLFKAIDVLVTFLAPAIGGSIGGVANLQLGDRRFRVVNAGFHTISSLGTAVTNFVPSCASRAFCCLTSVAMFQGRISR